MKDAHDQAQDQIGEKVAEWTTTRPAELRPQAVRRRVLTPLDTAFLGGLVGFVLLWLVVYAPQAMRP